MPEKPITNINNKLEEISQTLKNIRVDINIVKADIQLIKDNNKKETNLLIKEKEDIKKGWFFY